jgi:glucose/arabinose dehydrogenase
LIDYILNHRFMNRSSLSRCSLLLLLLCLSACYQLRKSHGGGQLSYSPDNVRAINPADILLPEGYTIEAVAANLTFPTAAAVDNNGRLYVIEAGYSYGEVFLTPRLLRIESDGSITTVAEGEKNGPWTGITFHEGNFYVAEGGELKGGRILRISPQGEITALVENLPSIGDHHTNGPVIKDGYIYFGQGTATNSAVVGTDNADYGWLYRYPNFNDTPCEDVVLSGHNYTSDNPLTDTPNDKATTGAYVPFGQATTEGQVIKGAVPCNGAIMRLPLNGGELEVVAWGLRNPYGLALSPQNELYITENSYDVRGNRPVWGTGDVLWKIQQGSWYGWPDFNGGIPLARLEQPDNEAPLPVLAKHPNKPPRPAAKLGVHSSSNGLDFSKSESFGYMGEAFVAQFGDMAPAVGKVWSPVGYKVVRVDVETGVVQDFAANKGGTGPASLLKNGGLERPVSVSFSPEGDAMYIVDYGILLMTNGESKPREKTGVVWKVTKKQ